MKIVVAGGSAAGAFAALMLARAGHQVLLFDQDRLEPVPDVEAAAASAFRSAAPHLVQPHKIIARCRELLRERLPDIYEGLLDAGVAEAPIRSQMPPSLADTPDWPGDERLTMMMARRSTIDWVLRRAILAEPGVSVRFGTRIMGLLAVPAVVPRVTGVRTDHGEVACDRVVDATGRRSQIDRWLGDIGASSTALCRAECGLAYFSRHYRLLPGSLLPGPATTRILAGLDEFTVGIWGGDNGTMQLAVAPLAADHRFAVVREPAVFDAVVRTLPAFAAWLEVLEPISDVFAMGGLHNTMRRLVVAGSPVAVGLLAIGDAACTTNPTFGRGLCMSLAGAANLVDTIGSRDGNAVAEAVELDRIADEQVAPFFADQAAIDSARLAMLRHAIAGTPPPDPRPSGPERITFAQLRVAASVDPVAFRAFWRIMGMLGKPDEIYADPDIVAGTLRSLDHHRRMPPAAQPTRKQLLAALAGGREAPIER